MIYKICSHQLSSAQVKHNIVIRRGHIAEEIIALANKDKVDLIVIGAKGRSGFLDVLMGSVAQRMSSAAKPPVLLINNDLCHIKSGYRSEFEAH